MTQAQDLLDSTTIVAIATPPGRGGIGVVRVSGADAMGIAQALFPQLADIGPRVARYAILRDADGTRVDDVIVTLFPAPHSYTGEDVLEMAAHGSPVVLDWLLRRCVALGAVPARAGEFTERAFLRGRLDLTEAEAVRDLIEAQTLEQAKLAAEQMGGSIATQLRPAKDALLLLIAALEVGIDFAEDDTPTMAPEQIAEAMAGVAAPLEALLASFAHGRLLRDGLQLAVAGRPNAGKSSLFNRLVERDRSIVTAAPGTTRDVVAERVSLGGVRVELLDTAGIREAADEAERMGVERSRQAVADADAVLLVVDASSRGGPTYGLDEAMVAALRNRPVVLAWNKTDLAGAAGLPVVDFAGAAVRTSAITGEGMDELRRELLRLAGGGVWTAGGAALTNLRQRDAVAAALAGLGRAAVASQATVPHEMVLLDLYETLRALDSLTGQTTADDVLNRIFSTFCIGK